MDIVQVLSLVLGVGCGCFLAEQCPPDWYGIGDSDSCYFFMNDKMNWYQANRTCAESLANLVVPNSLPERSFVWEVFSQLLGHQPDYELWIGCNDIEEEGNWYPCPLKGDNGYENWKVGEPSGANCAQMRITSDGEWEDADCTEYKYAVCEQQGKTTGTQHVETTMVPTTTQTDSSLGRLTPQCLLRHAMEELLGDGGVGSCGKACRSHPRCHSFNLPKQNGGKMVCLPSNT
ncbi:perlucin-like protein [Asterias amurensis]|uniref:perlucin-like protein n=1 Tax=Asterias amurensis TaxID=7602 RepID=UPI003AB146F9